MGEEAPAKARLELSGFRHVSSWELPLLEKGRLYLEAEEAYKYTEAEEAIIGSRLPTPAGGEAHLFSSIVIDEVEEEDDDEPGQDSA